MDRPRLAAVTFDCWGTLIYEPDPAEGHALRVAALLEAARRLGAAIEWEEADRALRGAHARHIELWTQRIASGALEMARWALEALGLPPEPSEHRRLATELAEASLAQEVLPLEGAHETLEALARRGIRRGLVCDTGFSPGRVVRKLLDRAGLLEWLEVQVFSDELGVPKPDPRPFLAALEALGADPERSAHVGDLRRTDVAGGRRLGMRTVRIRDVQDDRSELPDADWVADSHASLRALLLEPR